MIENCQAVNWVNGVNVTLSTSGTSITKTGSRTWDGGGVSDLAIQSGDGYAEYMVSSMSDYIMFGLSNGDSSQHYNDIDYAIYTYASTGYLYTYEGGVSTGSAGTYAVGDVLRVAVEGGKVKYYRNGTLLRTSGKAPVYPLLVDTSIRTASPGGWIKEPYIYKGIYGGARAEEVVYLHSDHLGSVSVATNGAGAVVSRQQYDPWGKVRSGGVTQTDLNYTGQRKDDTGLLYYHARYYDPSLARFVSPDSIIPSTEKNTQLTVDFHETIFVAAVAQRSSTLINEGFWSDNLQQDGPGRAANLNRYSYAENNPLRYTDPTGHTVYLTQKEAHLFVGLLRYEAAKTRGDTIAMAEIQNQYGKAVGAAADYLDGVDPVEAGGKGGKMLFLLGLLYELKSGWNDVESLQFAEDMAALADAIEEVSKGPGGVAITQISKTGGDFGGWFMAMNQLTGKTATSEYSYFSAGKNFPMGITQNMFQPDRDHHIDQRTGRWANGRPNTGGYYFAWAGKYTTANRLWEPCRAN